MVWYSIIGTVLLLLFLFWLIGRLQERARKKTITERFQKEFGTHHRNDYDAADLLRIRKFHDKICENHTRTDDFYIDEITWNDLGMDELFLQMNHTASMLGEEVLYHRLHCLKTSTAEDRFSRLIDEMEANSVMRLSIQYLLHEIGKVPRFSMTDVLSVANDRRIESNLPHYLLDAGLLLSLAAIFLSPGIGVLCFAILLSISILNYFKIKAEISPYFTTFAYIIRMVRASRRFSQMPISGFEIEAKRLAEIEKLFQPFCAGSILLSSTVKLTENLFEILLDYIRIFLHVDIIAFNQMLLFLQRHIDEIEEMRAIIGSLDASIAVASYRNAIPYYCKPRFVSNKRINFTEAYHPLLKEPVPNSIEDAGCVLITGSNASGKSTFIKTVALCAILAQTVGIVPAKDYEACRFRVMTSMALKDDILKKESYFIVEIKSLKRILDEAEREGVPLLCVIDEVLRGTNTVERIAASSRILNKLQEENVICFAATHDMELTGILEDTYENYHFDEAVRERDVIFSYQLKKDRATGRNAIRLLSIIGFSDAVVADATADADAFLHTNRWNKIKR